MSSASGRIPAERRLILVAFFSVIFSISSLSTYSQSGGGVDQTGTGGRHSIQGRIYFPSGSRTDVRVKVRLENFSAGDLTVLSDGNGSFVFRGLKSGSYTVVVDAGDDYQIVREPVYIDTDGVNPRRGITMPPVSRLFTVQVSLQLKNQAAIKAEVINAALAAVPEKAQTFYRGALAFIQAGESNKAIEQLLEALKLHPSFPLALNDLGVQYLKLGQTAKAVEALQKAVALTPAEFPPILNLGIALLNQKKYAEAEEQLRACLKLNSNVATAHMYLGIALAVQRKLSEGQAELELAIKSNSAEIALAHKYLAGIFLERREYTQAADQLETYLRLVPKAPDHDLLSRKVLELRRK